MSQPPSNTIGQKVRQLRLERGLSQDELAGGRYSKAYISALELGRLRPSANALIFLANQLDVPLARLLADDSVELQEERNLLRLAEARYNLLCRDYVAARTSLGQIDRSLLYTPQRETLRLLEAELALGEGQPGAALRLLEGSKQISRSQPEIIVAQALLSARAHLLLGSLSAAKEAADRGLAALRQAGVKHLHLELAMLLTLMQIMTITNPAAALTLEPDIARVAAQATNPIIAAQVRREMASATSGWDRQAEREQLDYATGLAELDANRRLAQSAATALAQLSHAAGDDVAAAHYHRQALKYARMSGNPAQLAAAAIPMAIYHLDSGQLDEAALALSEAEAAAHLDVDGVLVGKTLLTQARLRAARGEEQAASATFERAIAALTIAPDSKALGDAYYHYAQALRSWGRTEDSARYLALAFAATNLLQQ